MNDKPSSGRASARPDSGRAAKLLLSTFRIATPRAPGEGLRIGATRYLPRGVKKEDYARLDYFDVWLPTVAPSGELVRRYKSTEDSTRFFAQYEAELRKGSEARQTILLLAMIALRTPISIGCYCEEESRCHRSVLRAVIAEAAFGRWPEKGAD